MGSIKRALFVLVILFLAACVLFFVLENQQSVSLVLIGWAAPAIPLAVIVMGALLVGLVVGPLIGLFFVMSRKGRASRAGGPE